MNSHLHIISCAPGEHEKVSNCLSCGAAVTGNFCSNCSEATNRHVPGVGEFIHEFIGHFIALEGKLVKTLAFLLIRPGAITAEFLRGRRVPFVPPLRLYLSLSLVFFALIKLYGISLPQVLIEDGTIGVTYHAHDVQTDETFSGPNRKQEINIGNANSPPVPASEKSASRRILEKAFPAYAEKLNRFIREPDALKSDTLNHGFLAFLPYVLVASLPLFALFLQLTYVGTGRRYGEHLIFALHANALAFLIASVMIVIPGQITMSMIMSITGHFELIRGWNVVQFIPFLYLLAYLPLAMHRVYGGSRSATFIRWILLIGAHLSSIAAGTFVAELIAVLT